MHKLFGSYMLRSRHEVILSLCSSGSNGSCSSERFKLSNSTGPNINGLYILAANALSKLAGTNKSKSSSFLNISALFASPSSTGSSSAFPFAPFLFLAFAFFAASRAYNFLSSKLFFKALFASSNYLVCSLASMLALVNSSPIFKAMSL
jgi:hypothetical protein